MASPSPAARKPAQQSSNPKTPTKPRPGQTPQRAGRAPPKLGQSAQKAGQAAKSAPSTPKAAGSSQPKTDKPPTSEKPDTEDVGAKATQAPSQEEKASESKGSDDAQKQVKGSLGGGSVSDDGSDDEPLSKVTQAGDDAGGELKHAAPEPIDDDDEEEQGGDLPKEANGQSREVADEAERKTGDVADDAEEDDKTVSDEQQGSEQESNQNGGLLSGAKNLAGKASGITKKSKNATDKAGSAPEEATKQANGVANGTEKEPTKPVEDTAEDAKQDAQDAGEDVKQDAQGAVEDTEDDAAEKAEQIGDAADDAQKSAEDGVGEPADGVEDKAQDVDDLANDVQEKAEDGADEVDEATKETEDQAEDTVEDGTTGIQKPADLPLDTSVLKGLEVGEDGNVLDQDQNPIGRLAEGDAEDLAGYPIGDDGEILDEDGDLVGRVELLPSEIKRQLQAAREEGGDLPEGADEYLEQLDNEDDDEGQDDEEDGIYDAANNLPGLDILDGLTCQTDGLVYDADGNTVGKVTDGDPEQLQQATLNDQGEFIDDNGNVVGHADLHEEVAELVEQGVYHARDHTSGEEDEDEGAGEEEGEGVEDVGENVGEDVADAVEDVEEAPEEIEDQLPGIEALQGRELNEAGEIVDDQGNLLAAIEDEDLKQKIKDGELDPNSLAVDEQGQVVDEDGNVLGKTELVEGAAERLAGLLDFRILDGKKINKKGKIFDDDGEVIGELTDGELADCTGQKVNDKGEIHNRKGQLVGHVRVVPGEAAQNATKELLEELAELEGEDEPEAEEEPAEAGQEDLSILEGLKVNKKGQVLNEDGEPIGELSSGDVKQCAGKKINDSGEVLDSRGEVIGHVRTLAQEDETPDVSHLEGFKVNKKGQVLNEDGDAIGELAEGDVSQCAGKKINDQGEVLDASGNVIGKVRTLGDTQDEPAAEEEEEEEEEIEADAGGDQLPPLSILEGLKVNKAGNILDADGNIIGQLIEGNAKKLSKSGLTSDAEGQFWDNQGHVIGRAQTVPAENAEEEAIFAGLEGLRVVDDGWVQDANGHTVGVVAEGDPKKLIGREVDEDGDILDKKGSVIGHAERYEAEEEAEAPEQQQDDLSFLQGKTINKAGLVIGDDGVPVARLVEGKPKELAGRKLDDQGQLWNDSGKVVGRIELIPEEERDQKPEGPFAGLEDLRVIKGGKVADEDGNVVGEIVEGNARRLVGLSVDEDGDIVDKYGNVKGRAEPLAEEDAADYSVLDGMTVNKQGNVVDSNGVPYGKLVEGNASELAGRQCDESGYIYNDTGKIVGRCEPLPEDERVARPEGPFAGLQGLRVAKGGKVVDEDGNEVGELTDGDPKRLVGLSVDEDGDIIDKFGNTKGHAEPLADEEEAEAVDNSVLNNKTVNKQGYVVDEKGIPFGRLVEGNASEIAGRKCDEQGNIYGDTGKVVGRCEVLPENERVARPEGPFAGLEGLRVVKHGYVEDADGNTVGQISDGNPKRLVGLHVDEDGDIIDKYGNVKGHAEPWEEEDEEEADLSALAGTVINKAGYAVDGNGAVVGQVAEGDVKHLIGKKVDGEGQIWDGAGNVVGRCELTHGVGEPEGPFAGFDGLQIQKDGTVTTPGGDVIGRVIEGDIKKLLGHTVDEDGDITDKNGNTIGKAERWEAEEKERRANPMSGKRVNKEGEVRDENGDLMGRLTEGDLGHCVGQEIDDAGNVVDVDGNKIGEVTLLANIAEDEYEGPSEEELAEAAKREEEREIAGQMSAICARTLERMQPVCKQITEAMERADRTPKEELDEEELVNEVKPLIEEGGRVLQECNGELRGLDPDGHIAAQAKGRAGTGEATPEEYRLAETLKELTTTVVKTIDNAKKKLQDMPHAKRKLNPLWSLLTQPLFQILAAVGLLLTGVLGLVGQLLNALGLGGLVNGLLGGLGINKLLSSLGLGGDDKKKKKGKGGNPLGNIPVVGGLLGGKGD